MASLCGTLPRFQTETRDPWTEDLCVFQGSQHSPSGSHRSTCCLCGYRFTGHFTPVGSSTVCPSMTGFFRLAQCLLRLFLWWHTRVFDVSRVNSSSTASMGWWTQGCFRFFPFIAHVLNTDHVVSSTILEGGAEELDDRNGTVLCWCFQQHCFDSWPIYGSSLTFRPDKAAPLQGLD